MSRAFAWRPKGGATGMQRAGGQLAQAAPPIPAGGASTTGGADLATLPLARNNRSLPLARNSRSLLTTAAER